MSKYKEYLVDFGTMVVIAENEDEAFKKAQKLIDAGEISIDTIEDGGEYELVEGEEID